MLPVTQKGSGRVDRGAPHLVRRKVTSQRGELPVEERCTGQQKGRCLVPWSRQRDSRCAREVSRKERGELRLGVAGLSSFSFRSVVPCLVSLSQTP